jgi:hypothetical protein
MEIETTVMVTWMTPMLAYLKEGVRSTDMVVARRLRYKASGYMMVPCTREDSISLIDMYQWRRMHPYSEGGAWKDLQQLLGGWFPRYEGKDSSFED